MASSSGLVRADAATDTDAAADGATASSPPARAARFASDSDAWPPTASGAGAAGSSGSAAASRVLRDVSLCERKPYLGGYRDVRSGLEYHHALTQTPSERESRWANAAPRYSRETQTTDTSTRSAQTYREAAAQTARYGLLPDTRADKVLRPRNYTTADEVMLVRHHMALLIQCHWRGFVARRRADTKKAEHVARAMRDAQLAREAEAAAAKAYERDVERRLHPRTIEDFAILYDEVEAWRTAETTRIKTEFGHDEVAVKEQLAMLLAKETALLSTVERLRTSAGKENAEAAIDRKLSSMAAPKTWVLTDGTPASVETPYTVRAKELKALYDGLAQELPMEQRAELLLHVKYTIMEFDCVLTREMSALIERETDLLARKRPAAAMTGLRQRLRTLFLTFCETPAFNPEAARFAKMPSALPTAVTTKFLDTTGSVPASAVPPLR